MPAERRSGRATGRAPPRLDAEAEEPREESKDDRPRHYADEHAVHLHPGREEARHPGAFDTLPLTPDAVVPLYGDGPSLLNVHP
jgi:hypothetical protein